MKKILFVTYGGGHVNIINEIAKSLLNEDGVSFKILALTSAYNSLLRSYSLENLKKVSDYDYLFDDLREDILYWGNKLLLENYNKNGVVSKEETIYYIGSSYVDLVFKYGKKDAANFYKEKKRGAFLPTTIIERIIEEENFDTIIATTSPRFELASIIVGNKLKKRTIQVLDLFGEIHPLPQAKEIITMNKEVTQSLISQGVNNSLFYEYGQPSIEKTVKNIKKINTCILKDNLGIKKDKKILMLATQKLIEFKEDLSKGKVVDNKIIYKILFKILFKIVKDYNLYLFLRIHPSENLSFYEEFIEYKECFVLNNHLNSIESVAISDYVITHSSTLGIEAVSSGKTVFTYKHDFDNCYPVKQMQNEPFKHSTLNKLEDSIVKFLKKGNSNKEEVSFLPNDSVKKIKKLILI